MAAVKKKASVNEGNVYKPPTISLVLVLVSFLSKPSYFLHAVSVNNSLIELTASVLIILIK